jgi:hypothetical protein
MLLASFKNKASANPSAPAQKKQKLNMVHGPKALQATFSKLSQDLASCFKQVANLAK